MGKPTLSKPQEGGDDVHHAPYDLKSMLQWRKQREPGELKHLSSTKLKRKSECRDFQSSGESKWKEAKPACVALRIGFEPR